MTRLEMVKELLALVKDQPHKVRHPLTFDLAVQTDQVVADRLARTRVKLCTDPWHENKGICMKPCSQCGAKRD